MSWTHESQNEQYKIYHHATSPYFTPGESGSSLLATISAPGTEYIHTSALADSHNGFYIVVVEYSTGSAQSNPLAKVNFALE